MLTLLRKYQKSIFLVVSVMVIASFLFFGINNSVHSQGKEKNWKLGEAVDGSSIHGLDIKRLSRFLASDISDLMIFEKRGSPNLFNDGAVKSEIIDSGVARELYVRFEDELKDDLNERFQKFRGYTPYLHPQKLIGAASVWQQYGGDADLYNQWDHFKSLGSDLNVGVFNTLLNLYVAQKKLPPGIVRQILLYQQYQYGEMIQPDTYLQTGDLALFNAKSLTDWFGPKFLELSALFIHNADIRARKLGYHASLDEARASLIENVMKGLRQVEPNRNVTKEEFSRYMLNQLAAINMTEEEAAKVWQKVLTTRRWLDDSGSGVFVDQMLYKSYFDYAYKGAKIEHYTLPESVQFQFVDDMLKFEIYLGLIGHRENLLDMPTQFYFVEEMKSQTPELLEKRFIVDVSSKERDEIAMQVSLKDSLDWQLSSENWGKLVDKFVVLSSYGGESFDEKHDFINRLSEKDRASIDTFVRSNIINEHPEMVLETLSQSKTSIQEIVIPMIKSRNILRTLSDHKTILYLLETAMLRNEVSNELDVESAIKLSCYSEDDKTYHSIKLIDRDEEFHVMSFEKANKSGFLDQLLGEKFRKQYADGRYREQYDDALPKVKQVVFSKILSAIEDHAQVKEASFETVDKRLNFARRNRMEFYMRHRLEDAKNGLFIPKSGNKTFSSKEFLQPLNPLEDSWHPERAEESILRNSNHPSFDDALFEMCASSWSGVESKLGESPCFYYVLDSYIDPSPVESRMKKGREFLSTEARTHMIRNFLDEAIEKKAICLTAIEADSEAESE